MGNRPVFFYIIMMQIDYNFYFGGFIAVRAPWVGACLLGAAAQGRPYKMAGMIRLSRPFAERRAEGLGAGRMKRLKVHRDRLGVGLGHVKGRHLGVAPEGLGVLDPLIDPVRVQPETGT